MLLGGAGILVIVLVILIAVEPGSSPSYLPTQTIPTTPTAPSITPSSPLVTDEQLEWARQKVDIAQEYYSYAWNVWMDARADLPHPSDPSYSEAYSRTWRAYNAMLKAKQKLSETQAELINLEIQYR